MKSMLMRWYGLKPQQAVAQSPAHALVTTMKSQMRTEMMAPMMAAQPGSATDLAMLRLMIPHHAMAVLESRAARPGTTHDALRETEKSIIRSQKHEIHLMNTWLRARYC